MSDNPSAEPSPRPRFTIWGVLVAIAIVVLSCGFMVPNVTRVRKAANRMSCTNNLKQIGLALHNYESSWTFLPAGTVGQPGAAPEERLSWMVELLPYIEQENLYKRLARDGGWAANEDRLRVKIMTFRCPQWQEDQPEIDAGYTPYVGSAGLGPDAPELPAKHVRTGAFGYERRTSIHQIEMSDGTSNTALVLESTRRNGPWAKGGVTTVRGLDTADQPYVGLGRQFGGIHFADSRKFFGLGRGASMGCCVAAADGSVRMLRDEASPQTLEALMTIAGGEPYPKDW